MNWGAHCCALEPRMGTSAHPRRMSDQSSTGMRLQKRGTHGLRRRQTLNNPPWCRVPGRGILSSVISKLQEANKMNLHVQAALSLIAAGRLESIQSNERFRAGRWCCSNQAAMARRPPVRLLCLRDIIVMQRTERSSRGVPNASWIDSRCKTERGFKRSAGRNERREQCKWAPCAAAKQRSKFL